MADSKDSVDVQPKHDAGDGAQVGGDDVIAVDMLPWLELFCWSVLGFVPWLYWINGPAVTTDQAVVQALMISAALIGGVTLRIRAIRLKRKSQDSKAIELTAKREAAGTQKT
jgi:hypothetical protein